MKIESIHIKGFKSIKDLKIEGLSDINVFFGQNNVGKSNLFEAIAICNRLLINGSNLSISKLVKEFGQIFALDGNGIIDLQLNIRLDKDERERVHSDIRLLNSNPILSFFCQLNSQNQDNLRPEVKAIVSNRGEVSYPPGKYQLDWPEFHLIHAQRQFQRELMSTKDAQAKTKVVSHNNLKQALFDAYNSLDFQQKKRLAAIRDILNSPPFELGELDIARDPNNNEINIGFIRPNGRLPIENMGSGTQQLLLMLGQIFLNDYPIIALEEPEMNLSPQYQSLLLETLRQLMKDPAVKLNQLFISTHSPHLEFQENFFHVFLDEEGYTQVERATKVQHAQHFAVTPTGPDTGARLNSLNQVKLYQGLIDDLGLKWGDAVYFLRNEAGRWEIRPENEVVAEVKEVLEK